MAIEPDPGPAAHPAAAAPDRTGPGAPVDAQATLEALVAADPNLETATVTLPRDALDFLRDEAKKRGISTGDMLRISIGTQKFLTEKTAGGDKVQLKGSNGVFDVAI